MLVHWSPISADERSRAQQPERVSSRDVTEEVTDIDARLKNLRDLRGRFREVLSKAEKIEDILNIERELARIQTEIDAIEGRRESLLGSVNESKIDLELNQKTLLGPLGYLGRGIIWTISKLFVIK